MRDQSVHHRPGRAPLLVLLALPALVVCVRGVQADGIEGAQGLDAGPGAVGRNRANGTSGRAVAPASMKFERTELTGSPDGLAAPPTMPAARSSSSGSNAPTNEDLAVLAEVNRVRALRSLAPIRFDARLFSAARAHSEEQLASNFLGHGSPDPDRAKLSQRLTQGGYVGRMYAEVVAQNYADSASVVAAWMESPTHRAVLLDPDLTEGAFSRVSNVADPRVNRWTGDFGAPEGSKPRLAPAPVAPAPTAPSNAAPRTQPLAPPAVTRVGTSANPAPRSQMPPPGTNTSRAAALGGSRLVSPDATGNNSVPAPAFGSTLGTGAPRAAAPATLPGYAPPTYGQPAYAAPAPVPYRGPVYPRRPARRVGDCRT